MSNKILLNKFTFGFELEGLVENNVWLDDSTRLDKSVLQSKFDEILDGRGEMHYDGSITHTHDYDSFEYASPVLKFTPANLQKVLKLFDSLPSLHVKVDRSCGLHTHIAWENISKKSALWSIAYMAMTNNFNKFLHMGRFKFFQERYASCEFLKNAVNDWTWNGDYKSVGYELYSNEKYRVIRFHPQGTLEWRGPRNFLNNNKHEKNIKYIKFLTEFIKTINESFDVDNINGFEKNALFDNICWDNAEFNCLDSTIEVKKKIVRMLNRLRRNVSLINNFSDEGLDILHSWGRCSFAIDEDEIPQILRNTDRHINHYYYSDILTNIIKNEDFEISSMSVFRIFNSSYTLSSFVTKLNEDFVMNNLAELGDINMLTRIYDALISIEGKNNSLVQKMRKYSIDNLGKSSIKTFSYNVLTRMINDDKYNIKIIFDKDLSNMFGEIRAKRLINGAISKFYGNDDDNEIYSKLLESPNGEIFKEIMNDMNINVQNSESNGQIVFTVM